MKRGRCIVGVCLILVTLFLLMTGCRGDNTAKTNGESQVTANKTESDTINNQGDHSKHEVKKISILNSTNWPIPGDVDVNNNKWTNIYKEAFPDVEIEWIITPSSSLNEKKNILIATGDMPDLLGCNDLDLVNWAEKGLIQPLDDVVKEHYPNQKKYFTQQTLKYAFYKGKQYCLLTPANSLQNPTTLQVRKDWLDKMGLTVPQTLNEIFEVMKKFTFEDPDANGKDDTFGYTSGKNLGLMAWVFSAYDVNENFWSKVDGKIIPDIIRPEMKDALAYINKLYSAGVYDKDSLVQTNIQVEEKVTSGNIGFTEFYSWGIGRRIAPALKEKGMEIVPMKPLKGPNGKRMYPSGLPVWGRFVVSATCEYPEIPVKIINWLLDSDESLPYKNINNDKLNCGEIGVNCILDEKLNFLTEYYDTPQGEYDRYRFSYRLLASYGHIADVEEKAGMLNYDAMKAVAPYVQYNDKILTGKIEAEKFGELKTYYDEIKMQIVTGNVGIDEFDKWVAFFYKNGGQDIIDEVNTLNR
ncbi:MAG: extracellular solute-binding protein [Firmicutes bacterium]|nr:extracellular solute-binding protein [Bacillota bacterium]